jgi:phosphoglycolate phosphatase
VLALIDIDGTLCRHLGGAHRNAFIESARQVTGLPLSIEDWDALYAARLVQGSTDMLILRNLLRRHGLSEEEINEVQPAIKEIMIERYQEFILHDTNEPDLIEGAVEGITEVAEAGVTVALLTGNVEPIAYEKIRLIGFPDNVFVRGQGAFGSDAEDRNTFVSVALERYAQPSEWVCVVGDTPKDIEAARAGGVSAIAVTSGDYDSSQLSEADVVIPTVRELKEALLALNWPLQG